MMSPDADRSPTNARLRALGVDVGGALNLVGSLIAYLALAFLFPAAIAVGYGEPVWPFVLPPCSPRASASGLSS